MKPDSRTEADVKTTLQRLADAFRNRDLTAFSECFAPDPDLVLYGTGADEKRIGLGAIRAQVERDWTQSESAAMLFDSTSVFAVGPVAWAAIDGAVKFRAGGQDGTIPVRVSFVLEKREGRWLVVHAHFSTPAAAQEEGQSF